MDRLGPGIWNEGRGLRRRRGAASMRPYGTVCVAGLVRSAQDAAERVNRHFESIWRLSQVTWQNGRRARANAVVKDSAQELEARGDCDFFAFDRDGFGRGEPERLQHFDARCSSRSRTESPCDDLCARTGEIGRSHLLSRLRILSG